MPSKAQMSGMRGVYLVAAELSRRGFIVSPTSRSAAGADLLVTDQRCRRAYSVQVKTNARVFDFWLTGKKVKDTVSDSHIYVLVNIRETKKLGVQIDYFVVPSRQVARVGHHDGDWPHIARAKIARHQDAWSVFGDPV